MKKNLLITEKQFEKIVDSLLLEKVGVPDYILESGRILFEVVASILKNIDTKESQYENSVDVNLPVGDMFFTKLNLTITVHTLPDKNDGVEMASASVGNYFRFDNNILMQVNLMSREVDLIINLVAPENWKPEDLYNSFIKGKERNISIMAHELKHKYDRQKKRVELLGDTAKYQAYSSGVLNFGIPAINKFMLYCYYIDSTENLVRPTEVASRMMENGITKSEFYNFITQDEVFRTFKNIRDFSFEKFVEELKGQEEQMDRLLKYINENPENMDVNEKIQIVLRLVHINLVNTKAQKFEEFFYVVNDKFDEKTAIEMKLMFGIEVPKEKVKLKFLMDLLKYENNPIKFFEDQCEEFGYVADKMIKRISKVYALLPDEEINENNSIVDWELHQQIMEKKYGRRKIDTEYKFKPKK